MYFLCAAPGPVRNLVCNKSALPSQLSFTWDVPSILGEGVNGYQVEVKELQHSPDTKDVVLVDVATLNTKMKWASLDQGLRKP